ncbi:MAG: cytochrome c oxidase subunit II [Acidobacteriota bacterium]
MKVDLYERIWLWGATAMIVGFLAAVLFGAGTHAVHPPSNMETLDPEKVYTHSEFSRPRVETQEDGSILVVGLAQLYAFQPSVIRVPAGVPVTFRMTSPDVIHGFQVVGTNANAMIVPGYVSQFTTTFQEPGEYLVLCNEYCGVAHHLMYSKLIVEETP